MSMLIGHDYSDAELAAFEARLQAQGYRLAYKKPGEDPGPGKYTKHLYQETLESADGSRRWNLRWWEG